MKMRRLSQYEAVELGVPGYSAPPPYLIFRKLVKALNIVQKPEHSVAEIGGRVVL